MFIDINTRYNEAKYKYQAYNLQEVLDILENEPNENLDYTSIIEMIYKDHEIEALKKRLELITNDRDRWYNKYTNTILKENDGKIQELYAEYEALEAKVNAEIESLKLEKKALKRELKSGKIDNKSYQRQLTPLKKHIEELQYSLFEFKDNKVREIFSNEDITFHLIEKYIHNIRNPQPTSPNS